VVSEEEEPGVAATGAELRRFASALGIVLGVLVPIGAAGAEPADSAVRAARQLFVDAERDEDGGRWADALEKMRRVLEVKRTGGVEYHIALCEEHLGQVAAALDDYTAAQGLAREENAHDVLRLVGKRIDDLGRRVPRLILRIAPEAPDAVVTLDGAKIPLALVGTSIPVDPGDHHIEVTAPGRTPASKTVTLHERDAVTAELTLAVAPAAQPPPSPPVPALPQPATPPATSETVPPPLRPESSGQAHTAAWLATGGAALLIVGGVGAYALAGSAHDSGRASCAQEVTTAAGACDGKKNAVRTWDFTAAGAWIGAASLGAVAVVFWAQPPAQASASVGLSLGPGTLGLAGRF
jgi:hypothetical protein